MRNTFQFCFSNHFSLLIQMMPLQEERAHWKEVREATKRWNSAGADDKKQDRCHAREKSMFLSPSPSLRASDSCNCPLAVSAPTYLLPSFSLKCRGLASALQAVCGSPLQMLCGLSTHLSKHRVYLAASHHLLRNRFSGDLDKSLPLKNLIH